MPVQRRWVLDPIRGVAVAMPAGVMGILNATPDSFSDGGRHLDPQAAVRAGLDMVRAGADWLDVGGESTRPGAAPVSADDEIRRVVPVIRGLRAAGVRTPISIDTSKGIVAAAALQAGASVVNDVSAGADPRLLEACAAACCPLILMHMQGEPQTMQQGPHYNNVVTEIADYLCDRITAAVCAGIAKSSIVVDPGIGFGKSSQHNLRLLRALSRIGEATKRPLAIGVSRKSFLSAYSGGGVPPEQRDAQSHVLHGMLAHRCALIRVHDVGGARAAIRLASDLDHIEPTSEAA